MDKIEKEIKKIEEQDAWDENDQIVPMVVKKPLDKVIPIRLSSEKWEQIRQEARELGIGPSTLTRMWILDRLRQKIKAV
jgi:predicted DNA binding CopG/RHH family protein